MTPSPAARRHGARRRRLLSGASTRRRLWRGRVPGLASTRRGRLRSASSRRAGARAASPRRWARSSTARSPSTCGSRRLVVTAATRCPRTAPSSRARHPVTYVPARNTIFLALASATPRRAGRATSGGHERARLLGYPDCRPNTSGSKGRAARHPRGCRGVGLPHSRAAMELDRRHHPLGLELGLDYAMTHSATTRATTGRRARVRRVASPAPGFQAVGLADPPRRVRSRREPSVRVSSPRSPLRGRASAADGAPDPSARASTATRSGSSRAGG